MLCLFKMIPFGYSRNFLEMLKSYLSNIGKDTFYSKELRKEFRIAPTTLKRRLRELNAYGYIKIIGGASAKGYEYELVTNGEYDKLKSNIDDALEKAFKSLSEWVSGGPKLKVAHLIVEYSLKTQKKA